jgi:hypothetical protein
MLTIWPEEAYQLHIRPCFLCGKEAPYWCNHCINREDSEATDLRLHMEERFGSPLPKAYILANMAGVLCQDCYDESYSIANGTTI